MGFTFTSEKGDASYAASCIAFCICGEYNLSPSRVESLGQSKQSTQMTFVERAFRNYCPVEVCVLKYGFDFSFGSSGLTIR